MFLCTYEETGAYVAIKYLNATLRRDSEFMERYRTEAQRLVEIDDQNVVKLYEYVETPTRSAVVMELVDGVSLRTLLTEHSRTSPEAALAVLKGTLLALSAAHDKGVTHRDCKPENVLVQADGTSKLADFGVVVHVEEPGVPAGSPPYMSPELWTQGTAGVSSDLYAAACLLFECVKSRPPYRADDVAALRDKHLVEPVPLEVVPDTLRDLLRRGLAKDPAIRYGSAAQFATELEEDAVAGYGPDWEKRGRRHLAELATILALRFPLAQAVPSAEEPTATRTRLVARVPQLPPHLWIAGGAVATVLIALLISGGRMPPGPGTLLLPPDKSTSEPTPVDLRQPTTKPSQKARQTPTPTPTPTTAPASIPSSTRSVAPPTPPVTTPSATASAPASAAARAPAVQAATIVTWTGSAGAVKVAADGTGPLVVHLRYTRRDGDGPARTVHSDRLNLNGRTSYTQGVLRDLGKVGCGKRAHFGIMLLTVPAAANGPQISEVAVDGPACATPTPTPAPSAAHSPDRSTSAVGTPTPIPTPTEQPFSQPTTPEPEATE